MMSHDRFHLLLLTRNRHDSVRRIIDAAIMTAERHRDVVLTVADGGGDDALQAWLRTRPTGCVRHLAATCLRERLARSLELPSEWTLFLADDDLFTVNYLDVLITTARAAAADVAVVAPTHYLAYQGDQFQVARRTPRIVDDRATARLLAHFAASATTGTLFYSAIRTRVVGAWHDYTRARPYVPSYGDQLLTALAVASGHVLTTTEPTVILRDEANWSTIPNAIRSDARFYPTPETTFLHELLWVADLVELFAGREDFSLILPALQYRARELLPLLYMFHQQRVDTLGIRPGPVIAAALRQAAPCTEVILTSDDPVAVNEAFATLHGLARATEHALAGHLSAVA